MEQTPPRRPRKPTIPPDALKIMYPDVPASAGDLETRAWAITKLLAGMTPSQAFMALQKGLDQFRRAERSDIVHSLRIANPKPSRGERNFLGIIGE